MREFIFIPCLEKQGAISEFQMEAASLLGKREGTQGTQDAQHLMHLHKSQQVENKGIPTHPYWWSLTSWAVHMTGTAP